MRILDGFYRVFGYIKGAGLAASGLALFLMIMMITLDVIWRNFLGRSIPGVYEVVGFYLMPMSVLPILFYAFAAGISPRIPLVADRLPDAAQKGLYILVLLTEMALMLLVMYYSFQYAKDGMAAGHAFSAGGSMYPKYPFYFLVPFAFLGMAIEIAFVVLKNLCSNTMWLTYMKDQATARNEIPT